MLYNKMCKTEEFKTIFQVLECMRGHLPLPYFGGRIELGDIYGDIGKYVGHQFHRFTKDCPIKIKIAFLAIMSVGAWESDGFAYNFDFPYENDVFHAWEDVQRRYNSHKTIYVRVSDDPYDAEYLVQPIVFGMDRRANIVSSYFSINGPEHNTVVYVLPEYAKTMWTMGNVLNSDGNKITYCLPRHAEYVIRDETTDEVGNTRCTLHQWSGSRMVPLFDRTFGADSIKTCTEYNAYMDQLIEEYVAFI